MRTELYSVRSSEEEILYINKNLRKIVNKLSKEAAVKVLFKTEIDWNPKKIKADLFESLVENNPPELHIFLNAIDTKDNSAFCTLFSPFFRSLEKEILRSAPPEYKKSGLYPHIQVRTLEGLPSEYPVYCFSYKRRKVLVLPEIKLMGNDPCEYICKAVVAAKDLFFKMYEECPEGYIYTSDKPVTLKSRVTSWLKKNKTAQAEEFPKGSALTEKNAEVEPEQAFTEDVLPAENPPVKEESPFIAEILAKEEIPEAEETPSEKGILKAEVPAKKETPCITEPPASKEPLPETNPVLKEEPKLSQKTQTPETEPQTEDTSYDAPVLNVMDIQTKHTQDFIIFDEDDSPEPEPQVTIIEEEDDLTAQKQEKETPAPAEDSPAVKKKSGFKSFLKSFIPMKGDTPKGVFLKIIVLVAIVAFIIGAGLLIKFYIIDPGVNEADMEEIQSIFHSSPTQAVTDPEGNVIATVDEVGRNWDGVKKINKEIVGWINIDKTKIDYPILFHKEDNENSQFYLYKNYKKKYSDFGSIFMDYRCTKGIDSQHVILHGHNMGSDDSMFGSLLKYARKSGLTQGNTKFYKSSPIVKLDTPKGNSEWIIFAVMKIDVANSNKTIFNYLQTEFNGSAQYMNFIYNIKQRSYLNVNVPINENDRLLTLSTCSYETDNMRTIVVAREIRKNEDVSKYIDSVKQSNPNSIVYTDFATEHAAGSLEWYDGTGKLNGDGELEFMEQKDMFTVTFVDAKGKKIIKQYVLKGEDATAPVGAPPIKESDSKYYYTFKEWSPSFKNVTKNLTIKPIYDRFLKPTDSPATQAPATQAPDPIETIAPTTETPTTLAPATEIATTAAVQTTLPETQAPTLTPDPMEATAAE